MGRRGEEAVASKRGAAAASSGATSSGGTANKRRRLTAGQKAAEKLRDNYAGFSEYETDVKVMSYKGDEACTLRERLVRAIEAPQEQRGKFGPVYHRELRVLYKEASGVHKALKSADEKAVSVEGAGSGSSSSAGPREPVESGLMRASTSLIEQ